MKTHVCTTIAFGLLLTAFGSYCPAAPLPPGERPKEKANLSGFIGGIDGLAFSPDGQTLASAGGDGTVRLWDSANGKNTAAFKHPPEQGGPSWVTAVAFSADGKTVASSGLATIKLWDAISGKETGTIRGSSENLLFSPDGKQLVVTDSRFVWDLEKKKARTILENATLWRPIAAFDSTGKLLVAGIDSEPMAPRTETFSLWGPETGKKTMTFKGHAAWVVGLAFSPDCKTMASTGDDYTVRLWDVATGKNLATFKDVPAAWSGMGSPAFSPDGKVLACGYLYQGVDGRKPRRGAVRLYEIATGKHLATLLGSESGPCAHIVFSPDGKLLAAGCAQKYIALWSLPRRYADEVPETHAPPSRPATFQGQAIPLPPALRPQKGLVLKGHTSPVPNRWIVYVSSLAFSPDNRTLASAGHKDGTVKLWDVASGKNVATFSHFEVPNPDKDLSAVAFSPDGKTVASGGRDQAIKLWDVATGKNTTTLPAEGSVTVLTFSPDGKTLAATGAARSGLRLWDLETKKVRILLKTQLRGRSAVAFGPKDKLLVVDNRSFDGPSFSLWDANQAKRLTVFKGHSELVRQIAISRDGKKAASVGNDYDLRLWDTDTGKNTATFQPFPRLGTPVFSYDGNILACGSQEDPARVSPGAVHLYEVSTGKVLAILKGHMGLAGVMAFSPDGRLLAFVDSDSTIVLWKLPALWHPEK